MTEYAALLNEIATFETAVNTKDVELRKAEAQADVVEIPLSVIRRVEKAEQARRQRESERQRNEFRKAVADIERLHAGLTKPAEPKAPKPAEPSRQERAEAFCKSFEAAVAGGRLSSYETGLLTARAHRLGLFGGIVRD